MQKKLAILLAFFIVFAPIYSNAVLPALAATVASNGGRVLIGQTIKKVAPSAIANARKALVGICQKNPNYCRGAGAALGLKLISDGWNIDVTNNDVTNDIDVDIYKIPQGSSCQLQIAWGANKESADVIYNRFMSQYYKGRPHPTEGLNLLKAAEKQQLEEFKDYKGADWRDGTFVRYYIYYDHQDDVGKPFYERSVNRSSQAFVRCVPWTSNNKIDITNNELNQYITNNNINDIDILDIYNFDFSQYNNINIGGDTYNGTTINNDLAKSDPSETDKKVSADLKKKLDAKELSLDDVTDENCTKNEAGEYDKCGATEEPPVDEEPEEPVESPIECDANGFYKKVCDWMDWTQTKHDKPESGNIDIVDKSDGLDINDDRITFDDQCPPPTPIELVVMGFPYSEELNYQPFCDFFGMLNPFVVGMGGISSALIIAGGIRRG